MDLPIPSRAQCINSFGRCAVEFLPHVHTNGITLYDKENYILYVVGGETSMINLILVRYEFSKALQSEAVMMMMLSAHSRWTSIKTKTPPRPSETTYETAMLVTPHPRQLHCKLRMLCQHFQL